MQKLLVVIIALAGNYALQWYANYAGTVKNTGSILGIKYDSMLGSSLDLTLQYFWLLLLINVAFSYTAKSGMEAFGSFIAFIFIWLASGPIAALILNTVQGKEAINLLHIFGIVLIFAGSVFISANKEILNLLSK